MLRARILGGQADAVRAADEQMQFCGDLVGEQRGVEKNGVLRGDDGVVGGGEEKGGRGAGGNVPFGREEFHLGGVGAISEEIEAGAAVDVKVLHGDNGVCEDEEVGAGGLPVDGVLLVRRGGGEVVEGGGGGGEVASCGKATHANVVGGDAQGGGAGANGADGALGVG